MSISIFNQHKQPGHREHLYRQTLHRGRRIKRLRAVSRVSAIVVVALVVTSITVAVDHHATIGHPPTIVAPTQPTKPKPGHSSSPLGSPELVAFQSLQESSLPLPNVEGAPVTADGATWTLVSTPSDIELVKVSGTPPAVSGHIDIVARSAVASTSQIAQPIISGHTAWIASTLGLFQIDLAAEKITATLPDHLGTPQSLVSAGNSLWLFGNTLNASRNIVSLLERIDPTNGSITGMYRLPGSCAGATLIAQGSTLWAETIPCGSSNQAHVSGFSITTDTVIANYSFTTEHEFQLESVHDGLLWGSIYNAHLDIAAVSETTGSLVHVLHIPGSAIGLGTVSTSTNIWSLGNREAVLLNPENGKTIRTIVAPRNVLFVAMGIGKSSLWIREGDGLLKVPTVSQTSSRNRDGDRRFERKRT